MKLIKNFFWNSGYQLFLLLVPLITVPYIARTLGPTGVGINAYTNSVVQYFVLAGTLGMSIYGNREIAYVRDDPERFRRTFWELMVMQVVVGLVAIAAFCGYLLVVAQYRQYFWLQGIALIAMLFDVTWLFYGLENFKLTVTRNVLIKLATIASIFLLVKTPADTGLYIAILASSLLLGNWALWPHTWKLTKPFDRRGLQPFRHLKPLVLLFVPQVAAQLYLQLNKTLLGVFAGVVASGYYDMADKVARMGIAVVTALGTVMLPYVAHHFKKGNHALVASALRFSMSLTLALAIPIGLGMIVLAPEFTELFFGRNFTAVVPLMQLEALVLVAVGISGVIGTQFLLPTNQVRLYTTAVLLGVVVNVVLAWPAIHFANGIGAMATTAVAAAVVAGYQLWGLRKQLAISRLFDDAWKYLVAAMAMAVVVRGVLAVGTVSWWWLVAAAGLGAVAYALVLLLLRPGVLLSQAKQMLKDAKAPLEMEED